MDKGIRPYVNAKFIELNAQRKAGTLTNTAFRKAVMAAAMEDFGITLASAATHYNHAFQAVKKAAPAEVEGLGRPDDKKGGRKRKEVAPTAPSVIPVPVSALLQNFINAGVVQTPALPATEAAAEGDTAEAVEKVQEEQQEAAPVLHSVRKVSDGSVVAEGLTLADAEALIAKAAAAKKAKLELVA